MPETLSRLAYTPKEAGELLGISAKTVQRMAERGEIPFKEIRGAGNGKRVHILIPAAALQKWLAKPDEPRQAKMERKAREISKSAVARLRGKTRKCASRA